MVVLLVGLGFWRSNPRVGLQGQEEYSACPTGEVHPYCPVPPPRMKSQYVFDLPDYHSCARGQLVVLLSPHIHRQLEARGKEESSEESQRCRAQGDVCPCSSWCWVDSGRSPSALSGRGLIWSWLQQLPQGTYLTQKNVAAAQWAVPRRQL